MLFWGVGIDLIEIERIEKSVAREGFLTRFFGAEELGEYRSRSSRASYIAANFCAKEAFSKALGTGIRGFALKDIQLLRDGLGKPYLAFSGSAAETVRNKGLLFEASVSHTKLYATAVVIAYRHGGLQTTNKSKGLFE